jgi:hypothetical protein
MAEGERFADGHITLLSRFSQRPCERAPFQPQPIPSIHRVEVFTRQRRARLSFLCRPPHKGEGHCENTSLLR